MARQVIQFYRDELLALLQKKYITDKTQFDLFIADLTSALCSEYDGDVHLVVGLGSDISVPKSTSLVLSQVGGKFFVEAKDGATIVKIEIKAKIPPKQGD